jgi:hypothetical protein
MHELSTGAAAGAGAGAAADLSALWRAGTPADRAQISPKLKMLEEPKMGYHLSEPSYGSFSRSIPLPSGVDTDKANAEVKNGVLTVTLPKTQEALARVKKIDFKAS